MAYYWVAVNGKQVGLPFDNLGAAKKLLLNPLAVTGHTDVAERFVRLMPFIPSGVRRFRSA